MIISIAIFHSFHLYQSGIKSLNVSPSYPNETLTYHDESQITCRCRHKLVHVRKPQGLDQLVVGELSGRVKVHPQSSGKENCETGKAK